MNPGLDSSGMMMESWISRHVLCYVTCKASEVMIK